MFTVGKMKIFQFLTQWIEQNFSCISNYDKTFFFTLNHDKQFAATLLLLCMPNSVAQSDARPTGDQGVAGSIHAGSGIILS